MSENLSPIGFWSYARQDDEEKLSGLRSILQRQLQQKYGREQIKIFQDVAAIPPGADWNQKITEALHSSTFLIPIITPNFLESEWCNQEVFLFIERERSIAAQFPQLAASRRIFPIFYIDIAEVEAFDPRLLPELRKRQWTNFRDLIYKDEKDESVRLRLDQIAEGIVKVLRFDQRAVRERTNTAAISQQFAQQNATQAQAETPAAPLETPQLRKSRSKTVSMLAYAVPLCVVVLAAILFVSFRYHHNPASTPPAASSTAAPAPPPSPFDQAKAAQARGDYATAAQLFNQACANGTGTPEACVNLGNMYRTGQGVSADVSKAGQLFQQACKAGDQNGCTQYNVLQAAIKALEQ